MMRTISTVLVYLLASTRADLPVMWETILLFAPLSMAQALSSSLHASDPCVSFEHTPTLYMRSFSLRGMVVDAHICLILPAVVLAAAMRAWISVFWSPSAR